MLSIPRPTTRGECKAGARPCPWLLCKYHLLIEVTPSGALQLNAPRVTPGRPVALPSSAPSAVVDVWIDDALELLDLMPHTCALDVADLATIVHGHVVQARPIARIARALQLSERGARLAAEEARLSLPASLGRELA